MTSTELATLRRAVDSLYNQRSSADIQDNTDTALLNEADLVLGNAAASPITLLVDGVPYLSCHSVDAAGTALLAFRRLAPVRLTVSWPEADWQTEVTPTHPSEPHHRGHDYRSRIIEVWKELLAVQRSQREKEARR